MLALEYNSRATFSKKSSWILVPAKSSMSFSIATNTGCAACTMKWHFLPYVSRSFIGLSLHHKTVLMSLLPKQCTPHGNIVTEPFPRARNRTEQATRVLSANVRSALFNVHVSQLWDPKEARKGAVMRLTRSSLPSGDSF